LEEAKNIHISRSKRVVGTKERQEKSGSHGVEGGQAKRGYEDVNADERHEQWQEWAEEIWKRRPAHTIHAVATIIKETHPEIKQGIQSIRKIIKNPYR
jgi:hypothetical protein